MILQLRFSNSGLSVRARPSSVVHTGVKSLGWLKSTAQESPFQAWKEMGPWVVSAVKSGAMSPRRMAMRAAPVKCRCEESGPDYGYLNERGEAYRVVSSTGTPHSPARLA